MNSKVGTWFYDPEERVQMRLSGSAVLVTDEEVRRGPFNRLPFIKSRSERNLALFAVSQAGAAVWTREASSLPKQYVDL